MRCPWDALIPLESIDPSSDNFPLCNRQFPVEIPQSFLLFRRHSNTWVLPSFYFRMIKPDWHLQKMFYFKKRRKLIPNLPPTKVYSIQMSDLKITTQAAKSHLLSHSSALVGPSSTCSQEQVSPFLYRTESIFLRSLSWSYADYQDPYFSSSNLPDS